MSLAFDHPARHRLVGAGRWVLAGTIVLSAHTALGYGLHRMLEPEPQPAVAESLTVDLTPFLMATPEAVQSESIPVEQAEMVRETVEDAVTPIETAALSEQTPDERVVEDTEPDTVEPEATAEPLPETALPAPESPAETIREESVEEPLEEKVEEVAIAPAPDVAIPTPATRPVVEETPERVTKPQRRNPQQQRRTKPAEQPRTLQAEQPKPASNASSAVAASRAPTVSPARWHSQVYAAIARRKPRNAAARGDVSVSFVVTGSGSIVGASITRSSGNSKLDGIALDMVRSARIPPPPAGSGRYPFTIPVRFQ